MSDLRPFPYHRRHYVLEDIANTFVRDGYEAGNKRAQAWGWTLVVKYAEAGVDGDTIAADLDKLLEAWRAYTIPILAKAGR